ncbi:hypothetical protein ACLMJK_004303 [Lecanora helva]
MAPAVTSAAEIKGRGTPRETAGINMTGDTVADTKATTEAHKTVEKIFLPRGQYCADPIFELQYS